jgi:fused signal recognition particle receptor
MGLLEITLFLLLAVSLGVGVLILRRVAKLLPGEDEKRQLPVAKPERAEQPKAISEGEPAHEDAAAASEEAETDDDKSAVEPAVDDAAPVEKATSTSEPASKPAAALSPAQEAPKKAPLFAPPPGGSAPKLGPLPKLGAPGQKLPGAATPKPDKPAAHRPKAPVPLPVEKPKVVSPLDQRAEEKRRYREGLTKTRKGFVAKLARLFKGKPKVDDDLKDDVEEVLFTADIGAKTAEKLLAKVTQILDKKEVADPDAVWSVIREAALEIFESATEGNPSPDYEGRPPYVMLMIGVNGVGKTTTLGKLASRHQREGRKVLLVAGDTFRAAASEQLDVWARRVGCDIHTAEDGADPSSVIFDGISKGREGGYDIVLCDTAGRLHTKKNLMDELGKMGRAAAKALSKGGEQREPEEILLCLDATIGQNALAQAQLFKETMPFTGLVLTKLDGTAKGGVALGVCEELSVPIRHIGIGEGIDDLRDFDGEAFCDALFIRPESDD